MYNIISSTLLSTLLDSKEIRLLKSKMSRNTKSSADLSLADWARLGYIDWPDRQQPNLKETNHPMFHRSRFLGTDEEFLLISPAVRLASQLLYAPKSMLFIYSLVYECKMLPHEFDFQGLPCYEFRRTSEKNEPLIQARMDRIFGETGAHLIFVSTTLLSFPRPPRVSKALIL